MNIPAIKALISNAVRFLKQRYIFYIALMFFFLLHLYYIWNSTANIIKSDFFNPQIMGIIQRYCEGKLSLYDLWRPYCSIRPIGLVALLTGGIKYFHLNAHVAVYLSAFLLLFTVMIFFEYYRHKLSHLADNRNIQISFIPLLIVFFSLNQWENLTSGWFLLYFAALFSFMMTFILFDKMLIEGVSRAGIALYLLTMIFAFCFGCLFSSGFFLTIIIFCLASYFIDARDHAHKIKPILFFSVSALIFILIYNLGSSGGSNALKGLLYVLTHPVWSMQFFLLSLSANVFGNGLSDKYLSSGLSLFFGTSLLVIYIGSIVLYFSHSRLKERSYLPLIFILYSVVTSVLILIGRSFVLDVRYGMSSRYTTHTMLGLIGIIIIAISVVFQQHTRSLKTVLVKSACVFFVLFIVTGQILTDSVEWRISPYRKIYQNKLRQIALSPDKFSNKDLLMFQEEPENVLKGLKILKKYKLNVFSDGIDMPKIRKNIKTGVFFDLYKNLNRAEIKGKRPMSDNNWGSTVASIVIDGKPCIFSHPTSSLSYKITLPKNGKTAFKAAAGYHPASRDWNGSDGSIMEVKVAYGSRSKTVFKKNIRPRDRLSNINVPLDEYAGKNVILTLFSYNDKDKNDSGDWAVWYEPRIVFGK